MVSMSVFSVEVALSLTTFIEDEGNTSGAGGWQPLSTTSRVLLVTLLPMVALLVDLLPEVELRSSEVPLPKVALLPLETTATSAIVSAAPLPVVRTKR